MHMHICIVKDSMVMENVREITFIFFPKEVQKERFKLLDFFCNLFKCK
jgi:hypothetical protein